MTAAPEWWKDSGRCLIARLVWSELRRAGPLARIPKGDPPLGLRGSRGWARRDIDRHLETDLPLSALAERAAERDAELRALRVEVARLRTENEELRRRLGRAG